MRNAARGGGRSSDVIDGDKAARAAESYCYIAGEGVRTEMELFALRLVEWYRAKPGTVLDELKANVRAPHGSAPEAAWAVIARAVSGRPDLPDHIRAMSPMELLVLRSYTQKPIDVDRDLGWPGVPPPGTVGEPEGVARARARYERKYNSWEWLRKVGGVTQRNGSFFGPTCRAMREHGATEASAGTVQKWVKWICTIAALACQSYQRASNEVWRGLGGGGVDVQTVERHRKLRANDLIAWPAISSTSRNPAASEEYMLGTAVNATGKPTEERPGSIMFKIHGVRSGLHLRSISQYPAEDELLIGPLTLFQIVSVENDSRNRFGQGLVIEMRCLGPLGRPLSQSPQLLAFFAMVREDARRASEELARALPPESMDELAGEQSGSQMDDDSTSTSSTEPAADSPPQRPRSPPLLLEAAPMDGSLVLPDTRRPRRRRRSHHRDPADAPAVLPPGEGTLLPTARDSSRRDSWHDRWADGSASPDSPARLALADRPGGPCYAGALVPTDSDSPSSRRAARRVDAALVPTDSDSPSSRRAPARRDTALAALVPTDSESPSSRRAPARRRVDTALAARLPTDSDSPSSRRAPVRRDAALVPSPSSRRAPARRDTAATALVPTDSESPSSRRAPARRVDAALVPTDSDSPSVRRRQLRFGALPDAPEGSSGPAALVAALRPAEGRRRAETWLDSDSPSGRRERRAEGRRRAETALVPASDSPSARRHRAADGADAVLSLADSLRRHGSEGTAGRSGASVPLVGYEQPNYNGWLVTLDGPQEPPTPRPRDAADIHSPRVVSPPQLRSSDAGSAPDVWPASELRGVRLEMQVPLPEAGGARVLASCIEAATPPRVARPMGPELPPPPLTADRVTVVAPSVGLRVAGPAAASPGAHLPVAVSPPAAPAPAPAARAAAAAAADADDVAAGAAPAAAAQPLEEKRSRRVRPPALSASAMPSGPTPPASPEALPSRRGSVAAAAREPISSPIVVEVPTRGVGSFSEIPVATPAAAGTRGRLETIESIFKAIDRNGDGFLSRSEVIRGLGSPSVRGGLAEALGLPPVVPREGPTRDRFESVFQAIDQDDDRVISWDEFLDWVATRDGGAVESDGESDEEVG